MNNERHFTDRPDVKRWLRAPASQDLRDAITQSWSSRLLRSGNDTLCKSKPSPLQQMKKREAETA